MGSVWNFSISDTSSMLSYSPYSEVSLQSGVQDALKSGWITWYSTTGLNTAGGESGQGSTFHNTSLSGASVTLQFYGTGISLYGEANCSYSIIIDSGVAQSYSPSDVSDPGLLYSTGDTDLSASTHYITLVAAPTANTTGQLAFGSALITDASISYEPAPVLINNTNTDILQYSSNWDVPDTLIGIPNSTVSLPFHETSTYGSFVSLNFTGAYAVALYGPRNYGHQNYTIELDGVSTPHNASTFWLMGNEVLFFQSGLPLEETHSLRVVDSSPTGEKFILNWITLYNGTENPAPPNSSDTPTAGHKVNVGVIVGPIIAGVVVLALALFAFLRRRRRLMAMTAGDEVTPYPWWQNLVEVRYREQNRDRRPERVLQEKGASAVPTRQPSTHNLSQAAGARPAGAEPPAPASQQLPSDSSLPASLPAQPSFDVNRVLPMLAEVMQRIDRRPTRETDRDDTAPPEYPSS